MLDICHLSAREKLALISLRLLLREIGSVCKWDVARAGMALVIVRGVRTMNTGGHCEGRGPVQRSVTELHEALF